MKIKTKQHPLINKDSRHYELIADIEAVEVMEAMFTTEEMMTWAKVSYMKY